MLSESNFDIVNPNPKLAWEVFRKFSKIKVECIKRVHVFNEMNSTQF